MPFAFSFDRRATVGALALALLTSGCAVLGPRADRWTPPPMGASWEVAQTNTGSYGSDAVVRITRGEGVWEGEPVVTLRNSLGVTIMAGKDGHWRALVGPEGRTIASWHPPLGFEYPLTVGKSWVTPQQMMIGASRLAVAYDLACKVEAHEKVAVRAGTFDAFRIACTTTIGNEETYWTNPDMGVFIKTRLVRSEKNPFGAGTQESELVSAPAPRR